MKIAIVWNYPSRLLECSFRFEQYLKGFRALGHEPLVVCRRGSAEGFEGPVESADVDAFERPDFWRGIGAEVAVIVTWLRMPKVLEAIRAAGTRVIAITDSDGKIGVRVHPFDTFERMMVYQHSWLARARCLKYWLGRYLKEKTQISAEDQEALASARSSDALVTCSPRAARHLRRFLAHHGAEDLGRKVCAVPFNIGATFLSCPLPADKDERIVAIGRWDDPQKHPRLLVAALSRYLAGRPETEVVIIGAAGQQWFAPLAEKYPVSYRGLQRQDEVARTLAGCRSVIIPSRWESGPHTAWEGLTLGATIVGMAHIPGLVSWSEGGRFGHLAESSSPRALARAIRLEMAAWDEGRRQPHAIAQQWRSRMAPEKICGDLLSAPE